MELKEIKKLRKTVGTDQFNKYLDRLETGKKINTNKKSTASLVKEIDDFIEETTLKIQLSEVSRIVSLSYIAKEYFNKTRAWLYQRINNSTVNGKPARFTKEEIKTLNYAIRDISSRLAKIKVS